MVRSINPNLINPNSNSSRGNINNASSITSSSYRSSRVVTYIFVIIIILFPILSFISFHQYETIMKEQQLLIQLQGNTQQQQQHPQQQKRIKIVNKKEFMNTANTVMKKTNDVSNINDVSYNNSISIAGLSCDIHGGPSNEYSKEMIYWQDIPSDSLYISPLKHSIYKQYLTFEPDHGGWNNIRMAMETVVTMSFAMGRILVLPPEVPMYLLKSNKHTIHGKVQRNTFSFNHFFHMEQIHYEHIGLNIISMNEYLIETAMNGLMINIQTKEVSFPPYNRTNWDNQDEIQIKMLYHWLRTVSYVPLHWNPELCMAVFPASTNESDLILLQQYRDDILKNIPNYETYIDHPVLVNDTTFERMKENWAARNDICLYDHTMQSQLYIHFPSDHNLDARLLTHFYTFLFFQNYHIDLWMKRFVRDHIRYVDEIQCAAARIVKRVRERVSRRDPINNLNGDFHAFHVRRGDFQYKKTRIEAKELFEMAKRKIPAGSSIYIATDEKTKAFFRLLMDYYHVMFMDDFMDDELHGINSNYFGMIDALVASRSRIFYGCWFSTFTGYINRLRGYHADKEKLPGYENGIINSYYYVLEDRFDHMQHYYPIKKVFYAREFPTAWRLIDTSVGEPFTISTSS